MTIPHVVDSLAQLAARAVETHDDQASGWDLVRLECGCCMAWQMHRRGALRPHAVVQATAVDARGRSVGWQAQARLGNRLAVARAPSRYLAMAWADGVVAQETDIA
jgi:hypothetical protein